MPIGRGVWHTRDSATVAEAFSLVKWRWRNSKAVGLDEIRFRWSVISTDAMKRSQLLSRMKD
jgi:hypothetical protein